MANYSENNSLRGNLLKRLLGPLVLIGLIGMFDANIAAQNTSNEIADRLLRGSALAISERVFVNDEEELEVDIPYIALQMLTSSSDDRVFYKIEKNNGDFVTGYRQLDISNAKFVENADTVFFNSNFRKSPIRIAVYKDVASSNRKSFEYRVAVAETTNGRTAIAGQILLRSAIRQSLLIVSALVLVWIVVSYSLLPLSNLKKAIDRRNPEDMRPINHQVPNEVAGVVGKINDLLSRFSNALDALRNFTSNASHQFRTPLALIKTHLEIAQRTKSETERNEAIAKANKAVDGAERLMSQMLILANLDNVSRDELTNETCNLAQVSRDVCEEFVLQYSSKKGSKQLELSFDSIQELHVYGRDTLLKEVVRNLIDNAIVHGRQKVIVNVSISEQAGKACLSISDNGYGFSPAKNQTPVERTKNDKTSSGLGLKIVEDILNVTSGTIHFEHAEREGTTVNVFFKLA